MKFENTTGIDIPDHNHIGLDWHSFGVGVSYSHGFWFFEVGPVYYQWSKWR